MVSPLRCIRSLNPISIAAAMTVCPAHCARWASEYLGYCLCSTKDGVSLLLGLISVVSWGVAEIPQIITNYKTKSAKGLSFGFLFAWIIGDLFNLFGCLLEPATLPTQFYMAVLYTLTTLTLTLQSLYYGHLYHQLISHKEHLEDVKPDKTESLDACGRDVRRKLVNGDGRSKNTETGMSLPIPLPTAVRRWSSAEGESYYMSARSLSTLHTPTNRRVMINNDNCIDQPLLSATYPKPAAPACRKSLLCVASIGTLCFGSWKTYQKNDRNMNMAFEVPKQGFNHLRGIQYLVNDGKHMLYHGGQGDMVGSYLGWGMAVIYMGARLPQIYLNIKRGNVEGLNPLMFIFALLGNVTYVGSILVNSMEWSKIKPNIPWLVDAGGCVLLDSFIMLQFAYFHYWEHRRSVDEEEDGRLV